MNNIKKMTVILSLLLMLTLHLTSCNNKSFNLNFSEKYKQYLPEVEQYCINKNLRIKNYIGVTVINVGSIQPDKNLEKPIVYEWNVENIDSGEKMVLQYGPVLDNQPSSQIKNNNSPILLSKERYEITTKRF